MRFFVALTVFASAVTVLAEQFTVIVGKDGGLTYDPPFVNAKVGDTVAFQFVSKNHTVTQSTFAKPCERMTTPTVGIDSGFIPVAANATAFPQWSITINNASAPLWFYCAQQPHCSKGMVFAINPTAEKTYDAFKATALGSAAASSSASAGSVTATGSATVTGSGFTAPTNGAPSLSGSSVNLIAGIALAIAMLL